MHSLAQRTSKSCLETNLVLHFFKTKHVHTVCRLFKKHIYNFFLLRLSQAFIFFWGVWVVPMLYFPFYGFLYLLLIIWAKTPCNKRWDSSNTCLWMAFFKTKFNKRDLLIKPILGQSLAWIGFSLGTPHYVRLKGYCHKICPRCVIVVLSSDSW